MEQQIYAAAKRLRECRQVREVIEDGGSDEQIELAYAAAINAQLDLVEVVMETYERLYHPAPLYNADTARQMLEAQDE